MGLHEEPRASNMLSLLPGKPDPAEAIPRLLKVARSSDASMRVAAIDALRALRTPNPEIGPALARAAADPDPCVRGAALFALGLLPESEWLPIATNALDDPVPANRGQAISALARAKTGSEAVVTGLIQALSDSVEFVRRQARNALLQRSDERSRQALTDFERREAEVRRNERIRDELDPLLRSLADTVAIERIRAMHAIDDLKDIRHLGAPPIVHIALHDSIEEVRQDARHVLPRLPEAAPAVMESLLSATRSQDATLRARGVLALGPMAVLSDRALPAVLAAERDTSLAVRDAADEALKEIGKVWPEQVVPLVEFFARSRAATRFRAGDALVAAGPPAVPHLIPMLERSDQNLRGNVARILGEIGETDGSVARALTPLLNDPDFRIRQYAERSLEQLATPAAHDALVRHRGGVETHGPVERSLVLGNHVVKPDSPFLVAVALYSEFREPLQRTEFGPGLKTIRVRNEGWVYLCDVEARSVRRIARMEAPPELREEFWIQIAGWKDDNFYLKVAGGRRQRVRATWTPPTTKFVRMGLEGESVEVPALPEGLHSFYGYRSPVPGEKHYFNTDQQSGGISVQRTPGGPKVPTFRIDPEKAELVTVEP
jgi:HEAT repeat protein